MINALIVDDEGLARKGLQMIFPWERHGFRIVGEAASGEKALAFIQETSVQLVITDITMPKMSGIELMRELQRLHPAIKVVVVTCHQDFDYIQDALRLGAVDYIVKTQLEDQNLDEILIRISSRLQRSLAVEQDKPSDALPPNQDKEQLWHGLLWVVDDNKFSMMRNALVQEPAEIQQKLPEYVKLWQRYLSSYPNWGAHSNTPMNSCDTAWLEEIRRGIQQWLRKTTYSEEVIYAVVRSLELIHQSPVDELSQTDICGKVNLSKSYFSKVFKEIVGISFVYYLQRIYIDSAKQLLQNTNHPVYWIAERCGFSDTRYFSKVFRELTGMLPSDYRHRG
ncbi:response regulator [Paenibacillaceae bacterium]|nr:response regulator [Paenibacillaceae bacterium]